MPQKRLKGCGAGCEYLAVVPDGGVYPCHQFAGEKEYLLGNVFDMSLDESKRKIFASSNLFPKRTARTAGQNIFAAADARQMRCTSTAT